MKKACSIAILSLLNLISVQAVNVNEVQQAAVMTEQTRYIGSSGQFIDLAQTEGHARLELTSVRKFAAPQPIDAANL